MGAWSNAKIEPCYTGGGIYCFIGNIDNKVFFVADNACYDVYLFDVDLFSYGDSMYDIVFTGEFQEEHGAKILPNRNALVFCNHMFDWIERNAPKGNYQMSELEDLHDEVKELLNDCYDSNGNETKQWR